MLTKIADSATATRKMCRESSRIDKPKIKIISKDMIAISQQWLETVGRLSDLEAPLLPRQYIPPLPRRSHSIPPVSQDIS